MTCKGIIKVHKRAGHNPMGPTWSSREWKRFVSELDVNKPMPRATSFESFGFAWRFCVLRTRTTGLIRYLPPLNTEE